MINTFLTYEPYEPEETINLLFECPCCGDDFEIEVPLDGYIALMEGENIQKAFPRLSAEARESIISGFCPDCIKKTFKTRA